VLVVEPDPSWDELGPIHLAENCGPAFRQCTRSGQGCGEISGVHLSSCSSGLPCRPSGLSGSGCCVPLPWGLCGGACRSWSVLSSRLPIMISYRKMSSPVPSGAIPTRARLAAAHLSTAVRYPAVPAETVPRPEPADPRRLSSSDRVPALQMDSPDQHDPGYSSTAAHCSPALGVRRCPCG
jgi:hypothetical protein